MPPRRKPAEKIRLISAGFGRTGTLSLKTALQELGYSPYHMLDGVIQTPGQIDKWYDYVEASPGDKTAALDTLINEMLKAGFDSTTDFPACVIYKELADRYPDAKVILTVRSSGKQWASSVLQTIGKVHGIFARFPFNLTSFNQKFVKLSDWMWDSVNVKQSSNRELDPESLEKAHDAWKEQVIKNIPEERLLIHQATQGWEPLCKFLGAEVPNKPYPRVNDTEEFRRRFLRLEYVAKYWWVAVSTLAAGAAITIGYLLRG